MARLLLVLVALIGCGSPFGPTPERVADPPVVLAQPAVVAEPAPTPTTQQRGGEIVLAPLGPFPEHLAEAIELALEAEYDLPVRRLDTTALPKSAYYRPRRRYRADELLDHLLTLIADAPSSSRVLGITAVDISTTKGKFEDWGVFGLGYMPGRSAVISSYRLRRKARDRDHLQFRMAVTAVHEVGHTLGLDHCDEARCPMQDAEGSIRNTDTSTGHLGPGCRAKLDQ